MAPRRDAYQTALDLLSRRDHFRRELVDKLRRKGFPADEVEAAIARCQDLGLVDDERVAERFVEVRAATRGWGPNRLAAELRKRGVAPDDAERMARVSSELGEEAMRTALRKIEVRAPERWWQDSQRRARMISSLIARGFETDAAISAVTEMAAFRENTTDALDDQ
jgi:regulatory protein